MVGFFTDLFKSKKANRRQVGKSQRVKIARSQNLKCNHCGDNIGTNGLQYEIDHRNGRSNDNSIGNLQALCTDCHARKTKRQTKKRTNEKRQENNPFHIGNFDMGFVNQPEKNTTKRKKKKTVRTKSTESNDPFGLKNMEEMGFGFGDPKPKKSSRKRKNDDDMFGSGGFNW